MKYRITDTTHPKMKSLWRIEALTDIPLHKVKKGDFGGWVEKEENLSQEGSSWIADDAAVRENARVQDDALARDFVTMWCNALLAGEGVAGGLTALKDSAIVRGFAKIGRAQTRTRGLLKDSSYVKSGITPETEPAYDSPSIGGSVIIDGYVDVTGDPVITDSARLTDKVRVSGDPIIGGSVVLRGTVQVVAGAFLYTGDFDKGILNKPQES